MGQGFRTFEGGGSTGYSNIPRPLKLVQTARKIFAQEPVEAPLLASGRIHQIERRLDPTTINQLLLD